MVGVGFEPTNDLDGHCRCSRPGLGIDTPKAGAKPAQRAGLKGRVYEMCTARLIVLVIELIPGIASGGLLGACDEGSD